VLALGSAVPFVGPLTTDGDIKKFLFCRGFGNCTPTEGYQLLVIAQNLFFNHLRVFHRPRVAQLFQDQVMDRRGRTFRTQARLGVARP
jgi:hypothetical protein